MPNLNVCKALINQDTNEQFMEGDIVELIIRNPNFDKISVIGRIWVLSDLGLTLDISREYKQSTIDIKYKDIENITK